MMMRIKPVQRLLAVLLAVLMVATTIPMGAMGIKQAEASVAGHVVISELFYDESVDESSEFLELYNPTGTAVDISGWKVEHYDQKGSLQTKGTITIPNGSSIAPHSYFLIGGKKDLNSADWNGTIVTADVYFNPNTLHTWQNGGGDGVVLKDGTGTAIDGLQWGTKSGDPGSGVGEGTPATDVSAGKSLERKSDTNGVTDGQGNGWDTDNNANDFVVRNTPEPQNSSSPAEPPDTTAPTATVITATVDIGTEVITAQSNELGHVYLVPQGTTVTNKVYLDDLVTAKTATTSVVTAVYTNTYIATTGLTAGDYVVYAVDEAENVSTASTGIITLQDGSGGVTFTPINQVDTVNDQGVPNRLNEEVVIEGIATVGTGVLHGTRTEIYVQDDTGGMAIFDGSTGTAVNQGDKVRVSGKVGQHRGLTQLQKGAATPFIEVLSSGHSLPTPPVVLLSQLTVFSTAEPLEGNLVQVAAKVAAAPARAGSGYNVTISDLDGQNTITLRVADTTDIATSQLVAGNTYTITGVVGQRTGISAPHHDNYRILPRSQADIVAIGTAPDPDPVANVLISEIYGGGGNKDSHWRNDFIELYNPNNTDVSLDGWSVQRTSAKGTNFGVTPLTGTIPAHGFYLVQQAGGDSGDQVALPTPDATGTAAMGATSGKIALVKNIEAIADKADPDVVDFVGYGSTADEHEGTGPAPAPSNTTSIERKTIDGSDPTKGDGAAQGNGGDTDDNAHDFVVRERPEPQNTSMSEAPPADDTAPTVSTTNPANMATKVAVSTNITVNFCEAVLAGANYDDIIITGNGADVAYHASINDKVLTLNPNSDLEQGIQYTVAIPVGAVKDLANNPLAAAYPFSFTTLAEGESAVTPIDQVDVVDIDGIPTRIGEEVTIEGIATVGTGVLHASRTDIFVQDTTGGIRISGPEIIAPGIQQGDRVRVTGTIGHFGGVTQLGGRENPTIEILESNVALPTLQQIELSALNAFGTAEPLEGELVQVYVRIAKVPSSPAGDAYNVGIIDANGNNRSTMRVNETGTGIDVSELKVGDEYTVTGIVGQWDRSKSHHDGYQIFPRSKADLKFKKEGGPLPGDTVFPVISKVKSIADGDSITLEAPVIVGGQEITKVRFLGIDTPETLGSEDPEHNQKVHGQRATDFLTSLIPVGTEITLDVEQLKLDKFDRLLAYIQKGDLDVNAEMLRQGHAVSYVVWPNSYYDGRFEALRSAMVEARQNKRGIWDPADLLEEIPLKYRERKYGYAPEQYIGNFDTKKYVKFKDMLDVAIEDRVYFFSYDAVIAAGYTTGDWQTGGRNVIFIHPDGANAAHFHAARLMRDYGPEGELHWDRLPEVALYQPHILDNLQAGSVAGAVAHAAGIKTNFNYYGLDKDKQPVTTITEQARDAGYATGLINSGSITEPGTGVFVANVESRRDHTGIALQIAESNVDVILGGGERYFLPEGTQGRHGEGKRKDGRNLIEEMEGKGYTVVFTRDELAAIDPATTDKLLGLFAAKHTFNAKTEEYLKENNLPHYWDYSPTLAEMTTKAIAILSKNQKGFLLVMEEEGTDNFADGANNANATIEAVEWADDAIGVAVNFAATSPDTLVITAADSDAGGMNIFAPSASRIDGWKGTVPATAGAPGWHDPYENRAAADGIAGTATAPFTTGCGNYQFGIAWAGQSDFASTMVTRAYGLNSEYVHGMLDNTDIHNIMAKTLDLPMASDAAITPKNVDGSLAAGPRNVIFIHPDGANAAHYQAARLLQHGPAGQLNWDKLPAVALYTPHILDNLQAGSVAGAVAHATGEKTMFNYYGLDADGDKLSTITEQAQDAGFATGLVNSGTITEPGTGVFVAGVACRREHNEIAVQIAASGVDVILGGGEQHFLPQGTTGRHGESKRQDDRDLIAEMKAAGYTVVYTKAELAAINPATTDKLLGLFAANHTFNAKTEENLKKDNLPHYWDDSPTIAEMMAVAVEILSKNQKGFLLVAEEEGTDNFADGANNAAGTIKAIKRADAAIGKMLDFAKADGNTLVITAADSDAGGMTVFAPSPDRIAGWGNTVPATAGSATWHAPYQNMAAADGVGGTATAPFTTGCGKFQFGIAWAGQSDFASTMVTRAYGPGSDLVHGVIDNTDIYHIMKTVLFEDGIDAEKPDRRDRDDDDDDDDHRAGAGGATPPAADTVRADTAKDASKAVTDQLKKAQEGDTVAITAKKGETTLAVGGTALNQLAEKKAQLAVESKEAKATLEFDPQALLTDELKKAGKDALVEISAKMLQDQAAQAAADFADSIGGKKLQAYHFSVIVKEKPGAKTGTPVHQLNGEVTITLDVSDMLAEGANPALLAVFHKQPDGTWLERESTSDAKAKTLTFTTDSFSMFVVMEKPAVQNIIKLIIGQTIMMVDGKQQTMDVRPFIQTGTNRTMVPVRFVSEMLGAEVEWNEATRQVEIADGAKQIALTIGSKTVLVDGSKTTIDSAAEVLPPGRTFVPLRFISETLGAQVDYNDTTRQITITR